MCSFHQGFWNRSSQFSSILWKPVAIWTTCPFRVLCGTLFLEFCVHACVHVLSAISNLDLRVWPEIWYWALFCHTLAFMIFLPFHCLSSLISLTDSVFALFAWTWLEDLLAYLLYTSFVFLPFPDVLFQIMSLLTALPPFRSCQFSSPFSLFQEFKSHCWSYW